MTARIPAWTYSTPTATCRLEIPRLPGETFEAWLTRTMPLIRDGLGIKPAPPMDPFEWAALVRRASSAAPSAAGAAPAAASGKCSAATVKEG